VNTTLVALISVFAELVEHFVRAGEDKAKQEEAMMAAEEKLSRVRAKMRFGS
jgi:hypothetical protein